MKKVTLVCLANSIRESHRCVAGVDETGAWIRPVSPTNLGALTTSQIKLDNGADPALLDRITISVEAPQVLPYQPENWVIAAEPWKFAGHLGLTEAEEFLDKISYGGVGLFGDTQRYRTLTSLESSPLTHSLVLVEPSSLGFEYYYDGKWFYRATFVYDRSPYNLSVTDPVTRGVLRDLGQGSYGPTLSDRVRAGRTFLCVSLSGPYPDGRCWKLVAGVVPLP